MSLSQIVSGLGMSFFPVAALLLFLAVFLSVLVRLFLTYDASRSAAMARAALDEADAADAAAEVTP